MPLLRGKKKTNSDIANLKGIESIKRLAIDNTSIDDEGVQSLERALALEELEIVSTFISDVSMNVIGRLPVLKSLLIQSAPRVTDIGVGHLAQLRGLRELYLNYTQLSNSGVASLSNLLDLHSLSIQGTHVDDLGLSLLTSVPNLSSFNANNTAVRGHTFSKVQLRGNVVLLFEDSKVDDEGVDAIVESIHSVNVKEVTVLSLNRTLITDCGLKRLLECNKIRDLRLTGTNISDVGATLLLGKSFVRTVYLEGTNVSNGVISQLREDPTCHKRVYDK